MRPSLRRREAVDAVAHGDGVRIVLVTECFYPAVDGTTTTVKAVADRLLDRGHDVRIIAPGPGLGTYRGCPVTRVRPLEHPGRQVREALERVGPDVVHVSDPGAVGRKALEHARALGIRTVVVQAAPVPGAAADRWRAKVAERADAVLVTARWMRDRLADLGVEASAWSPGVDARAFTPAVRDTWLHGTWARARSPQGPQVVVGYVGALHRRHGVGRLAELVSVPGIRPVVIGDGPRRDRIAARLPGARMTAALDTGHRAVALASLDVLVHPGEEETCCHALREAAASGVPVVAPRAGGAREVVVPLETGLLYDPADPRGLASAVAAVAGDRRRHLLGAAGRLRALRRSWEDAVGELLDHYVGGAAAGPPAVGRAALWGEAVASL